MIKKIIALVALVIILVSGFAFADEAEDYTYYRGKVLEVRELVPTDEFTTKLQLLTVEITNKDLKGQVFEIENALTGNRYYDIDAKAGDKLLVVTDTMQGEYAMHVYDYQRDTYIYIIVGIFAAAILFVGKKQGLKTILTLAITLALVFKVFIPLILKGFDPVMLAIGISILITLSTLMIITGFSKKGFIAAAGTIFGVTLAGIIVLAIGSQVKLTGMSGEEATMLLYIPQNIEFNFSDLLFSGILIGALGAVMDVAMSISSSIHELHKLNPELSRKRLYSSGLTVGRDIMGTMTNTLILAYTGSSIPLLLLFSAYNNSLVKIINLDMIATEVIRSLSGSIGLVMTIPITAALAVMTIKD